MDYHGLRFGTNETVNFLVLREPDTVVVSLSHINAVVYIRYKNCLETLHLRTKGQMTADMLKLYVMYISDNISALMLQRGIQFVPHRFQQSPLCKTKPKIIKS